MKYRHKCYTEYNHGQGQSKIILNKPHSVSVCLPGSCEKGDGTCLRTYDPEKYKVPGGTPVKQKIILEIFFFFAFIQSVQDYTDQRHNKYGPVDTAHEKCLVKRKNRIINRIRNPMTRIYQEVQYLNMGGFSSGEESILFF